MSYAFEQPGKIVSQKVVPEIFEVKSFNRGREVGSMMGESVRYDEEICR